MASITFSGTSGISFFLPTASVSDYSNQNIRDGFNPLKKNLSDTRKKHNGRGLVSTNVASPPLPAVAPLLLPRRDSGNSGDRSHVAWTSVRQERWEGELLVQGEIPLWLVCEHNLINLYFFILYQRFHI